MKAKIYSALLASALMLGLGGCKEDYTETDIVVPTPMDTPANVVATPYVGSVIISWDLPASDQYYYTLVSYVDAQGKTVNRKVSKYSLDSDTPGRVKAIIPGFTDTNEYTFTLTAYSFAGDASESVAVSAAPEDRHRAKDYLVEDITFEPLAESLKVNWTNELGADLTLVVNTKDYFQVQGKINPIELTYDARVSNSAVIESQPVETDLEVTYYLVDNETGEKSVTKTYEFQSLPTQYDIYDEGKVYIPNSFYGKNQMSIEWNETKNEFFVLTSGTDPYIYTQMPQAPAGTKLIFRYHSVQNITNFEIFFNGLAPGGDNEIILKLPDPVAASGTYNGLRMTNGYWKTVIWDLSDFQKKYDFIANAPKNQNRIRIDFGGQNKRSLYFRNMHFE